jgi:DnaA-homolog protein
VKQITLDISVPTGPSLQNFLAGPNTEALQHVQLWLGAKPRSPLPCYVWGPEGSGKTHLLTAVRTVLQDEAQVPDTAFGWLDPTIAEPPPWSPQWAAVLLDDVHLYNAVQQHAAFNWFVHAQTAQRGVLAAGRLPVADLALREDLRTRLGWGHVYALQPLNEAERRSVLKQSAQTRGLHLGDEVIEFLLTRFSRDLGSLMEMLKLMDGYALQTKRAITVPMVKAMMEEGG